jgi:hypothetical protein
MLTICFVGYSQIIDVTGNLTKWAEIYQITLDSYLKQDTALNEGIDFIAIDLASLEFTNDYDKENIVIWFENHHVPVIDTNLSGLKDRGLFNEEFMYIPDGVFLKIIKVTEMNNEIIIEGMKYRGAEGANWFRTIWKLNNGIWEFISTFMTMIS